MTDSGRQSWLRDRAKITLPFLAGPFARRLRCSLLTDPLAGYARRSRLAGGQNSCAIKCEFIFARPLSCAPSQVFRNGSGVGQASPDASGVHGVSGSVSLTRCGSGPEARATPDASHTRQAKECGGKRRNAPHSRRFARQGRAAEVAKRLECAAFPRFGRPSAAPRRKLAWTSSNP